MAKYSINIINHLIRHMPHTKGYTLLSTVYNGVHSPLWWRYIDQSNKIHYCQINWGQFQKGIRFDNVNISHKDIVQEVFNTVGYRFSVLAICFDNSKHNSRYFLKVRHNCKKCNYSINWTRAYEFIKRGGVCNTCKGIKWGNRQRSSKKDLLKRIYGQYDNHNHLYVPNLSDFQNVSIPIKWTERIYSDLTRNHFIPFTMSVDGFLKGRRPDNNFKNEQYFNYLINKYCHLKLNKDYFHAYIPRMHSNTIFEGRFDFYFPNILNGLAIELNGVQHVKPVRWGNIPKSRIKGRYYYQRHCDNNKKKYCKQHHIKLLWIPCYYKSKITNKLSYSSFKIVKKNIKYYFLKYIYPLFTQQLSLF